MWKGGVQKPWLKNEQQQQRQSWNSGPPQQSWNNAPSQSWNNRPAQSWNNTPSHGKGSWNAPPQQAPRQAPQQAPRQQGGSSWQSGGRQSDENSNGGSFQNQKPLPDGVRVDKTARYLGKVIKYVKWSGYGWIELQDKNVIPDNTVFVFHKSLKSDDRFPFLMQDMVVELGLHPFGKKSAPGKIFIRAKTVTMPGGKPIAIQDSFDAEKKTFVGGQHLRYTGVLEWYSVQRQFGYVKMDEGFDLGGEPVPGNVKVEKAEVNSGGLEIPAKMKDIPVEFSIWKTKKGEYRVYNMTLPGMQPITAPALENRKVFRGQEFSGIVDSNWWKQGYGMIKLAEGTALPPQVQAKMKDNGLLYFRNSDIKDNGWVKKGMEVTFEVYFDDKGCGACEVSGPDSEVPM